MRILIAGIGNIFQGDDAFGVETVRRLSELPLPEGVRVVDFGIRSYDLAYAIMEGYDIVILVDATPRGEVPGTVYLMELEWGSAGQFGSEGANAHGLNPVAVLQMVQSLGGKSGGRIYLVGCEPAVLETENGELGLSPAVQAAVPEAIQLIQSLLNNLICGDHQQAESETLNEEFVPCETTTQEKL
ncbi:MAG TPA: hydrogenase maturation protease [Verrucomicrobiae bacterium]|nr:hydrogenase maturation protease [Verrucomicrobiae bacterium]